MLAVQGSCHQGHLKFRGNGRQCVANSACAIRHSYMVSLASWDTYTIDSVLQDGDQLHNTISEYHRHAYLTADSIPKETGTIVSQFYGTLTLKCTDAPAYRLEDAISISLEQEYHGGGIFTMGTSTPCYSSAIIKHKNLYYYFDPHSRNECGMLSSDGRATLTSHNSIFSLSSFIRHLASSLCLKGVIPFELACMKPAELLTDDSDSSFSGFSRNSSFSSVGSINEVLQNINDSSAYLNSIDIDQLNAYDYDDDSGSVNEQGDSCRTKNVDVENGDGENGESESGGDDEIEDPDYEYEGEDESGDDESDENVKIHETEKNDLIGNCSARQNVSEASQFEINHDDDVDDDDDDDDDVPLIMLRQRLNEMVSVSATESSQTENENVQINESASPVSSINFEGRPQQGRGRKRVRNETEWKRNIAKRRRCEGRSYHSEHTGKLRSARIIGPGCGINCRCKCKTKISETEREAIHHQFWMLGCTFKQWQFCSRFAKRKPKKSKRVDGTSRNRLNSIEWTLPVKGEVVRVCKTFFLHTLAISESVVFTAHSKNKDIGICSEDNRGRHENRPNRSTEEQEFQVRQHIESFKCIESHYCRKNTAKSYLPTDLSIKKMYQMYQQKCHEQGKQPVKECIYRRIFTTKYNLSFHTPIKDQCDFCNSFNNFSPELKAEKQAEFNKHISDKEKARSLKMTHKNIAKQSNDHAVACFDLEEVLLTPRSFESAIYYKRRLNSYNFTIYDLGNKDGKCFIWNECIAGRGACEIASCIYNFIQTKSQEGKKHFVFFSDNCFAQNKNKFYISMLWYSLQKFKLKSVKHIYLIKGHTQNEGDSMHATIEASAKGNRIFTTAQWAMTARMARRAHPYDVMEMSQFDFFDFKHLATHLKNFNINTENVKVDWRAFKTLQITAEEPNTLFYQTDFEEPEKAINLLHRWRSGRKPDPCRIALESLRDEWIPLRRDKYIDLVNLCASHIIPRVHHPFFIMLPHE